MTSRLDLLRSLVRSATKASRDRLAQVPAVANAQKAFEELKARRSSLSEGALGAAVAGTPGVKATTVSLREGRILVDLVHEDDRALVFALLPEKARFAPRGAKELLFSVEPPELVGDARVREIVGAVAAAIARALWGPVLGPRREAEQALVEREGARLRADLRTVPAVRAMLEGSPLAMALEVLSIESFDIAERTLRIKIALPLPPM